MNVSDLFSVIDGVLYAVRFDGEVHHEHRRCFLQWQDWDYLYQFFRDNPAVIDHHEHTTGERLSPAEAAAKILHEASAMEDALIAACDQQDPKDQRNELLNIFEFLHFDERGFDLPLVALKCKQPPGTWLRLYGWQCFLSDEEDDFVIFIVDGGIKTSQVMQEGVDTSISLTKMNATSTYILKNFIL